MRREVAEALAKQVGALLAPACAEVAIVGSIRRRRAEVKDIELLCRPHAPRPVFGEVRSAVNPLEALVARLVHTGQLGKHPDPSKRKDGPKYKTLWLPESGGIAVDLFIADPSGDNWGNLLAIRTGDYEFSQLLVTPAAERRAAAERLDAVRWFTCGTSGCRGRSGSGSPGSR